jgi:hypothetical protein
MDSRRYIDARIKANPTFSEDAINTQFQPQLHRLTRVKHCYGMKALFSPLY